MPNTKSGYLDPEYQFSHEYLAPLALSKKLPLLELPSLEYTQDRVTRLLKIADNAALAAARSVFDPLDALEDYDDVFVTMPEPRVARDWHSPATFAEQRVMGAHPNWIRKAVPRSGDEKLWDALRVELKRTMGERAAVVEAEHLFVCDHRQVLHGIPQGTWGPHAKHLPRAVAFFAWRSTGEDERGGLVPIGIRVERDDGTPVHAEPLITPFSPRFRWLQAQVSFQAADANVHEMWSHLYGGHFALEPFALAAGRYLSKDNPVRRLLQPHLRFLMANNEAGRVGLVNPSGPVDQLLAGPRTGSLEIVKRAAADFDLQKSSFVGSLRERQMLDGRLLPHYPYRDDGLLLWNAIGAHVGRIVGALLQGPSQAHRDEVQRFRDSLASPTEGRLRGIPNVDAQGLQLLLQHVVFTSGPYHAAVNYTQHDWMLFVPNQPLALYAEMPEQTGETDKEQQAALMRMLPPFGQTMKQLAVLDYLSSYRPDVLGTYGPDDFAQATPLERGSIEQFRLDLRAAEDRIHKRNRLRPLPYLELLPSRVPNSAAV
jgi:arachidonate 15-lipoxygenase